MRPLIMHMYLDWRRVNRLCGPVISECLICWGIFKITKIISEGRFGIEKDENYIKRKVALKCENGGFQA